MKLATNRFFGESYSFCGSPSAAARPTHDGDAVAHGHRLDLVVRDVDRRHAQLLLDAGDLRAHLHAQLRVEFRERLVHQEHLRLAHDRAAHRDALALAAGQLLRAPVQVRRQPEELGRPRDALVHDVLRRVSQTQPEADVVGDGEVRVERVVLEDHRDVPLLGRQVVHDALADRDLAFGDVLEPRDHPQRGRLAAARRADEHDELAVADLEREVVHGVHVVVVDLLDLFEDHVSHSSASKHGMTVHPQGTRRRQDRLRTASPPQRSGRRIGSCGARLARQSRRSSRVSRRYAITSSSTYAYLRLPRASVCDERRSAIRPAVLLEERRQRLVPRHRAARILAPLALEAELVAGEQHRDARRRHLQPDADELALFRSRHRAEPGRVVTVEDRPGVKNEVPRHPGAERPHRGGGSRTAAARHRNWQLEVAQRQLAAQPRPTPGARSRRSS
jgi:hypothetical protein